MKRFDMPFEKQAIFALFFLSTAIITNQVQAQLAAGKSKFLGNIVASSVPSNFSTYWNQVTPESRANGDRWKAQEM